MQQSIGQAIEGALDRKDSRHQDLADAVHVSRQLVGAWIRGERTPNVDDVTGMCRWFDDAALYTAVAGIVTSGVIGGALDGVEGRAAAYLLADVEMEEAMAALNAARGMLLSCPSRTDHEAALAFIMEILDARAACSKLIVAFCEEHGLSLKQIAERHRGRMLQRGYVRGRVA